MTMEISLLVLLLKANKYFQFKQGSKVQQKATYSNQFLFSKEIEQLLVGICAYFALQFLLVDVVHKVFYFHIDTHRSVWQSFT